MKFTKVKEANRGDALMPALFCLGALVAVEKQLRPDER